MSRLADGSLFFPRRDQRGRKWLVFLVAAILAALARPVRAQTNSPLYWNTGVTSGLWDSTSDWWTTPGGPTNPSAVPGAANDAVLNGTAPLTVQLGAPQSALGLYFNNTGTTLLDDANTGTLALSLGGDGINIASTAGAVALGSSTAANAMPISLTASQTWTNNSTAATGLTVVNAVSETASSTLTIAGSGNTAMSGVISNPTGTLSLTKSGAGTLTLTAADTFSGATTVNQGILTLGTGGSLANTSSVAVASGATMNLGGSANNQLGNSTQTNAIWNISGTLAVTTAFANTIYASTINLNNGTLTSTGTAPADFGGFFVNNSSHGAAVTIVANGAANTISGTETLGIQTGATLILNTPLATDALSVSTILGHGGNGTAGSVVKSGLGTAVFSAANVYTGATTVNGGTLVLDYSTSASVLSSSTAVKLGGGTLSLKGKSSGTTAQTLASLALNAGTLSGITLNPNGGSSTTLTITSATLGAGAGAALNFNLSAGTTNASTSTLGNTLVAWNPTLTAGGIIGGGYTLTDSGGIGFATVAGGKVVRLIDPGSAGLPTSGGSSTANYFVNQSYDPTFTMGGVGSLVETLSGGVAANTVSVDTTGLASGANLALGANALTLTSGGGMLFSGANPYMITASGGNLAASGTAGSLTFNNYNSSTAGVTISAPILDNSGTAVAFAGPGTTVLSGANTYTGGTYLDGGTLRVSAISDSGISNLGPSGALTLGGGTLVFTGVRGTTARSLAITAPSAINLSAGSTLGFTGTASGGGGLTVNGPGTLTLAVTNSAGANPNVSLYVGTTANDIGSLTINSGATVNLPQTYLLFGENGGGPAQLTINGGTLYHNAASGGTYLANSTGANSVLTLNGGAFAESSNFVIGQAPGTTSTVNLNSGTISVGVSALLSDFSASTAVWNQAGGLAAVAGQFQVGVISGSTDTVTLSGGTLLAPTNWIQLGMAGAGTMTISNNASAVAFQFLMSNGAGNSVMNLNGGSLLVTSSTSYVGFASTGTATWNQTSGTATFLTQVNVANGTGAGTLNISGGSFWDAGGIFYLGFNNTTGNAAALNVSGTAAVTLKQLNLGEQAGVNSVVNLNGGTLRIYAESGGANTTTALGTNTVNFNGGTLQVGANITTPNGMINVVQSGGAVIDTQSYAYTITSPFNAGANSTGGLTKFGAGTLTLNSSSGSTYVGATTLNGGTLLLNFANTSTNLLPATSALNLNAGATLNLTGTSSGSVSQNLGNLTLNNGGGSIVLNPNGGSITLALGNTWTANNNSTLLIDESAAGTSLFTANPSFNANGFIPWATVKTSTAFGFASLSSFVIGPYAPPGGTLPGAGASSSTDYGLAGTSASQSVTVSETANSLTIAPTAAGQSLAINPGQILSFTSGAVAFDGSSAAYSIAGPGQFGASNAALTLSTYGPNALTISAPISGGAGSLILGGAGRTILSGPNTYSGGTQLNSGTLSLGSAAALGSGTLTINGGTLDSSVASLVNANNNAQIWNGSFTFAGSNSLNLGTGNVTLGGNVQITSITNTLTVGGAISGNYGLTITGATPTSTGAVVFSGTSPNTYTGLTSINGIGTTTGVITPLVLSKSAGVAAIPGNVTLINNESSVLYVTADNQFAAGSVLSMIAGSGNARFELRGTTQTLAGLVNDGSGHGIVQNQEVSPANSGSSTLILNGSGNYYFNGLLRNQNGTLGLVYNGTGTQILSGANITYTGPTVINSGTLELYLNSTGSAIATNFNSATTVNTGATLQLYGNSTNNTNAPIVLNGGTINDLAYGYQTDEGPVILTANSTLNVTNSGASNQFFFDAGLYGVGQTLTINNYGATTTGESFRNSTGANFYGSVIVNGGQVGIGTTSTSAALVLANTDLTLNNATLGLGTSVFAIAPATGATLKSLNGNGTVTAASTAATAVTLTVGANNGTGTFSGTLINGNANGTLSLTKIGSGVETLTGANTATGTTTVAGGTLLLDFSTAGAPASNILASTSPLNLGAGTLSLKGGAGATNSQTVGGLTLSGGGYIVLNANGAANLLLTLGAIAPSTGTVDFTLPGGTQSATNGIVTSAVNNAAGILGAYATVGGANLATVSSGNIIAYTGYTNIAAMGDTVPNSATANVAIASAGTTGNDVLAASTTTISTLLQNSTTASTVTLPSQTLQTSGLLIGSGQAALTIGAAVNEGILQAPAAGGQLTLSNFSTAALTINSVIADNTSASPVVIGGTGTIILAGTNTYTGQTSVDGGVLRLGANVNLGAQATGATLNLSGGTLTATATFGLYNGAAGTNNRAVVLGSGGGTFDVTGSNMLTVAGVVSGAGGLTKTDSGTLILNTNETYTGATVVSGGILQVNGTNAATAGIGTSSGLTINSGGTVLAGPTDNGLFGSTAPVAVTINTGGTLNASSTHTYHLHGFVNLVGGILASPGTLSGSALADGYWDLDGGLAAGGAAATATSTISAVNVALTEAGGTNFLVNPSGTQSIAGVDLDVSGSFGAPTGITNTALLKSGTGVMRLDAANSYTGATIINAGTLVLGSGGATGSLSPTSTITDNGSLVFNRSISFVQGIDFSGSPISGSGSLTQAGAGPLTLNAANSYSGGTTINAGGLTVSNTSGSATGYGPVALNAGTLASGAVGTIAGVVTANSAPITISPGGTAQLGTLTLGGLTTGSGTTLQLATGTPNTTEIASNLGDLLAVAGSGNSLTLDPATTLLFYNGAPTASGFYPLIQYAGNAPSIPGSWTPAAFRGVSYAITTSAATNGYVFLQVTNSGANVAANWQPTAAGPYSWQTVGLTGWSGLTAPGISGDSAIFNAATTGAEIIQLNGTPHVGSITFAPGAGGSYTIAQNTGTDNLSLDNGASAAALTSSAGNNAISAPLYLISSNTNTSIAAGTTLTLSGVVAGTGSLTMASGGGTLLLSGNDTYTGATTITSGTLQIGAGGGSGSLSVASSISIGSGTTLIFDRNDSAAEDTIGSAVSGSGNWTFTSPGGTQVGRYTLTGNNSGFSGPISITNSRVQVTASNQLGNGSNPITVNSFGQLFANAAGTYTNPVTLNGGGWIETAGDYGALRLDNGATWATGITLAVDSRIGSSTTGGTISSVISDGGNVHGVTFTTLGGSASITLSGTSSNTYTGTTVVDAGNNTSGGGLYLNKTGGAFAIVGPVTMGLGNGDQPNLRMLASNQFAPGVVMTFANTNGNWARFDLRGTAQTLAGLVAGSTASATQAGAVIQNTGIDGVGSGTGMLTLNGNGSYFYYGYLRDMDSGAHTSTLALIKSGSGTQTLAGNQIIYTGATTINGGKLNLMSSATAFASATTVNSGGLIGVTGALSLGTGFTFTGSGGIDLVDGSIGTFTLSNASGITLAPTSGTSAPLNLEVSGATTDLVSVTHTLTVGAGGVTVNITNLSPTAQTYTIASAGTLTQTGSFSLGTILNPGSFTYALNTSGNNEQLVVTAATPLSAAYFVGSSSPLFNAAGNWALAATDTTATTQLAPTSGTDVYMGVNAVPAGNLANLNMTLGANATINSLTFTGAGTTAATSPITIGGSNTLTINAAAGAYAAGTGVVVQSGSANHTINTNVALAATQTWTVTDPTSTLTVGGQISGAGGLTKSGSGVLLLTNANSYTGGTNITGGTLRLQSLAVSAPSDAAGIYTFAQSNGTTITNAGSLGAAYNGTLSSSTVATGSGPNGGAAMAYSNANGEMLVALNNGQGIPLSGRVWTVSGWFSGITGTNYQTLFRGNLGDHQVILNTGTKTLGSYNSAPTGGGFVSSGDTLTAAQSTGWHQVTAVGANGVTTYYIDGVQVGTAAFQSLNDIYAVGNYQGGGQPFATQISDVYVYQSALTPAQIQQLYLANAGILPSNTPVTISGGALLDLNGSSQAIGSLSSADPTTRVALGGGTLITGSAATTDSFVGVISDSGSATSGTGGGLTKVGAGSFTLGGTTANAYSGLTVVANDGSSTVFGPLILAKTAGVNAVGGNVQIGNNGFGLAALNLGASQQIPDAATITFDGSPSNWAYFKMLGFNETIAGLNDSTTAGVVEVTESETGTGGSTLTLGGAGSYNYNGYIRNTNNGSGTLSLVMAGAGTQNLSGANITYTGPTSVVTGTLQLTNTTGFASTTYISSGATLQVNTSAGWTASTSFNIAGLGTLLKTGSGTWVIGGGTGRIHIQMLPGSLVDIEAGTIQDNNQANSWGLNQASVKIAAGATFDAFSENVFLDALTGSGTLQNGYVPNGLRAALIGVAGGSGTFSGIINNTGGNLALVKLGAGIETLTGANTYTGGTTIGGGTLDLDFSAGGAPASNILAAANTLSLVGGTLRVNGGASGTPSQTLAATTAAGGGLTISNSGAATSLTLASLTQATGGTLNVDLSQGGGANTVTLTSTAGLPAAGSAIGWISVKDATGTGLGTLSGNNIVRLTTTTVLTSTNATPSTGAVDFTTTPTDPAYSGGVLTLASGVQPATDSLAISSGSGGTLDLGGNTGANAMSFTSGGLVMSGSGNYTIQDGQLGASGATLIVNQTGAGTLTISATLSGGAGSLVKGGSGTLVLTAANSYTGGTTLDAGTLNINADAALGGTSSGLTFAGNATLQAGANNITLASTRAITINNGVFATFDTGTNNMTVSGAVGGAGGNLTKLGSGTLILGGGTTYTGISMVTAGTLQEGVGGATGTVTDEVYVASGATFEMYNNIQNATLPWSGLEGSGTVYYKGTNTPFNGLASYSTATSIPTAFTGTIVLDGARLNPASGPADFGGTSSIIVKPNGQLAIFAAGTYTLPVTIAGNGWTESGNTATDGAIRIQAGAVYAGNITMSGNARISATASSSDAITGNISGAGYQLEIGNTGTGGGNGTLTLAPTVGNVFSALEVSGVGNVDTLVAGNANAFPTAAPAALTMNGGTLRLNGFSFPFANLSGAAGIIQNGSASTVAVLTVGSDNTSTAYGGTLADGAAATLGLTKTGTGTLTLTGANTYTGPTTVNGGKLNVNNAAPLSASTNLTVNSGGTFGATGAVSLANSFTFNGSGGIDLVDGSIGTLTLSNVAGITLGTSAKAPLNVETSGASSDQLAVTGTNLLTVGASGVTVNVTNLTTPTASSYAIVSGVSPFSTGPFSLGTIVNPGNFTYSLQTSGGNENLILTAATPLTAAYFVGSGSAIFNASGNWALAATDTTSTTPLAPTAGTDVYLGVNNVPNPSNLNMTLGADTAINSLTFAGTGTTAATSPITIGGTNTLTINAAAGAYSAGTGIVVQSGSANHAINSNIALGAAQSWTVNGTSTLTVGGQISGTGALTKAGSGTLVLSNGSIYTGATNITGGTLRLSAANISNPLTANLAIQLDATNAASLGNPANGAIINSWNNSSAASLAAAGNFAGMASYLAADPALGNRPVVAFNGSQALANFTNLASNVTIFYVGQLTGTLNQRLVGGYSSNFLLGYWGGHQDTAYGGSFLGTGGTTATATATTAPHVYALSIDALKNAILYSSGAALGSGTNETGPNGLVLGGGNGSGVGEPSAGDIGELLVYNTALTQAQIQAVSAYLDAKWGLGMLPFSTAVTITSGATFDLNGLNQTIGSLASSDPQTRVTLGGATLTVGSDNTSTIFAGTISDAGGASSGTGGSLAKIGTGTLTLTGANSYGGLTTVASSGGNNTTLKLDVSGANGTTIVAIPSNFQFGSVNDVSGNTYVIAQAANQFSSTGTMLTFAGVNGTPVLELGGFNQSVVGINTTYTNAWIENSQNEAGFGNSILTLTGSGSYSWNGHIRDNGGSGGSGTLGLTMAGNSTLTLSGSGIIYSGPTTASSGTLVLSNTTGFRSSTAISSGATVNMVVPAGTLTVPATYAITGTGLLIKSGPGNWTIGANGIHVSMNMSGGQIDIQGGTIQDNFTQAEWTNNKASLNIASGAIMDAYADPVNVDALTGSGTLQNGFVGIGLTVTVGNNNTQNNAAYGVASNTATFSGIIGPTGTNANGVLTNFALTKVGSGTQILTGVSNYTGTTNVNGGTLAVNTGGSISTASAINVGGGTATGTLTVNGGSVATSVSNVFAFSVGNGSSGIFTISSGSLTASGAGAGFVLGNNGTAQWTQSGGTVSLAGNGGVYVGNNAGGASTMTISGGTFTASNSAINFGERAGSTLSISNAAVVTAQSLQYSPAGGIASTDTLSLGDGANFSGGGSIATGGTSGVLAVGSISNGIGTANFNFNGGTLRATGPSATFMAGLASATVQDAGGVINNSGFNITIGQGFAHGGVASTDGGLILQGAGVTALGGTSTFNGGVTVNSGTLQVTNTSGSATGSGAVNVGTSGGGATLAGSLAAGQGFIGGLVTIGSAGTLSASNAANAPTVTNATLTFAGGLTLSAGSSSSLTLNNSSPNGTSNPLINVSGGIFNVAGASTINVAFSSTLGTTSQTYDLFGYASASGIGAANASGTTIGNLTLNTTGLPAGLTYKLVNNTAANQVDLTIAQVLLTWGGQAGSGGSGAWDASSVNWFSGGAGTGIAFSNENAVGFNDSQYSGGPKVINNNITIASGGVSPSSVTFTNTNTPSTGVAYTITSSDTIGITGSTGITLSGSGTVALVGQNSYTGTTELDAGTLVIGNASSLGATSAPLTFNGGTLRYAASTTNTDVTSGRTVTVNSGGATIDVNGNSVTYASAVGNSGSGALTVADTAGGGTLILTATNTYTGGTTINAGATLQIGNGTSTDSLPSGTVTNNGSLVFNLASNPTVANNIGGGPSSTGTLTQLGGSTLTLSGVNTYGGATFIANGTLQLGASTALPSGTALRLGTVGNTSVGGVLDLNGYNATVSSLAVATGATASSQVIYGNSSGSGNGGNSGTLTFAGSQAPNSPDVFSGILQDQLFSFSPPPPRLILNVTSGALNLSGGNNTYTGDTTISGGTLQVSNPSGSSATGSGTVTVGNGGTLSGSTAASQGFITGQVNVNGGGKLAAFSGATLTLASLALDADSAATNSVVNFTLSGIPNGTSSPLINITTNNGFTAVGSTLSTVAITLTSTPQAGTYDLFGYSGTGLTTSNFNATVTGPAGFTYALINGTNQIDLTVSAAISGTTVTLTNPQGATVIRGGAGSLAVTLNNTGSSSLPGGAYSLTAADGGGTNITYGAANPSTAATGVGPGGNQAFTFSASTSGSSTLGNTTVTFTVPSGSSGVSNAPQMATATLTVLDHASGSASVTAGNNFYAHVGAANLSATVNLANATGTRSDLQVGNGTSGTPTIGGSGNTVSPSAAGPSFIMPGSSSNYTATLFTGGATAGAYTIPVSFTAGDRQTLPGASALSTISTNITGQVNYYAQPAFTLANSTANSSLSGAISGSGSNLTLTLIVPTTAANQVSNLTLANFLQNAIDQDNLAGTFAYSSAAGNYLTPSATLNGGSALNTSPLGPGVSNDPNSQALTLTYANGFGANNMAASVGTLMYTPTSVYGSNTSSIPGTSSVSINVQLESAAQNTLQSYSGGTGGPFGAAAVWSVQSNSAIGAGNSYAGLQSQAPTQTSANNAAAAFNGYGPLLKTTTQDALGNVGSGAPLYAQILAGSNSGMYTGNNPATVAMAWRNRTLQETSPPEGGMPASPPLQYVGSYLISNVLSLSGMTNTSGEPVQTDPFVLQMNYDTMLLSDEAGQAKKGTIYLGWLNPNASGGATWQKAFTGDFDGSGHQTGAAANGPDVGTAGLNYQGSFLDFVNSVVAAEHGTNGNPFFGDSAFTSGTISSLSSAQLSDILGAYGVDPSSGAHDVWAVINHNSQFAVVPEPSTLLLAALGLAGLAGYRVRRRMAAQ